MIVDAHQHVWDPDRHEYPWMTRADPALARRFDAGDLEAVAAPLGVGATVLVEAARTEAETLELLAVAADPATLVRAVVGWVDLTAADVEDRIAALPRRHLAGLRHNVEDEPDPDWLLRPEVLRGLRAVAAAGLTYDLLVLPHQLPAACGVAERVEGLALVLDHGGKPALGAWDSWSADVERLAGFEHVHCKLSGLGRDPDAERNGERLLELFGPHRLMFGSDWPVCTAGASYGDALDLARSVTARLGAGERDAVLGGTATAFYGIQG
jgi:L-fuconolactonase